MRLLALLALVGCSFPEKHRAGGDGGGGSDANPAQDGTGGNDGPIMGDGGPGAFGCVGFPFPTTAPAQITFQGKVQGTSSGGFFGYPVIGVSNQTGAQFFSTNTDTTGQFAQTVSTNGMAIDGHLVVDSSTTGELPTYYYPRRPFNADQLNMTLPVYDPATIQQLYSSVGRSYNSQQATLFIQLTDCNGSPIAGARLTMVPQQQGIYYMRNNVPDATVGMTDSTGIVLVLSVNPTNAQLGGQTAMGQPLHNYAISIMPQPVYEILIQP